MFGIYVAPDTDLQVRKNISLLAVSVWAASSDEVKYALGLTLEGYNTNLYQEKYVLGQQFFAAVSGNAFRSSNERSIIIDGLLDDLLAKHNGYDNFHHEAPVVDAIASYINGQQDILPNFAAKLIKVVLLCRIGRGLSYNNGVSPRGRPYYDRLIALLGDQYAPTALAALTQYELQAKLEREICRQQAIAVLTMLKSTVVNARLIESIDFLLQHLPANGKAIFDSRFKSLTAGYINWQ